MAACSGTQLTVDWFGMETDVLTISDWTNDQGRDREKRSKIVHAIIHNHSLDHLESILGSGWDVNETLMLPDHDKSFECGSVTLIRCYRRRTALYEAARKGWTEGVQMLLDAGAKCRTSGELVNPLTLALQNPDCPPAVIELLLNHGADPNQHTTEEDIPLLCAITHGRNTLHLSGIVTLLLGHGANPNIAGRVYIKKWVHSTALHEAARRGWAVGVKMLLDAGAECKPSGTVENPLLLALQNHDCPVDLIDLLLRHGADPNQHTDTLLQVISNGRNNPDLTRIVKLLLEHGVNLNVTHRINIGTNIEAPSVHAPHEAARCGWTDGVKTLLDAGAKLKISALHEGPLRGLTAGVKILLDAGVKPGASTQHETQYQGLPVGVKKRLDAGAKCEMSVGLENPLTLALQDHDCPIPLIDLLLKHRADPNQHDGTADNIPLLQAISNCRNNLDVIETVELLLAHGADPNVSVKRDYELQECPLSETLDQEPELFAALFQTLVHFGADVNYNVDGRLPLLHRMMFKSGPDDVMFLHKQLDLFFLHGGNINVEDVHHKTALEHAVRGESHSNSVRWLIRHGADISPIKTNLLKANFIAEYSDDPKFLILLQAGMRVSHGARTQLSNMEMAISTWLQDDTSDDKDISGRIGAMWDGMARALRRMHKFKKSTYPKYWSQQMVDLQEFSDESLHAYPVRDSHATYKTRREHWKVSLYHIHRMLEFLSQPQSLQWYCSRCVRENLVSLQPSVVKTLAIPVGLKRYILCHEI